MLESESQHIASDVKQHPVKLACQGVWKVFGPRARDLFRDGQTMPDDQQMADAGLICAVRDVSLDIHEGEIFIIMGLSGSGKSTLVRCMSRLIEPSAGQVEFEGRNLLHASPKELIEIRRHKMGMVFQHFALLPHLTVLENVAFPLEIQGVERKTLQSRALEMIELVGLKGREQYYPRELSGGQQQRVGIARSLAVEPDIWFLDEPFSALDPLIRREMQDEFLRIQSVLQKSIAFITHDFEEAIRLGDRIAIMKDGAVIQIGTPEILVTKPATSYVEEFTRDIPRAKVLSVASIMSPADDTTGFSGEVEAHVKIESVARQMINASRPIAVINNSGEIIGQLSRDTVVDVLVGTSSTS